ncbi:MAG: immunity 50 family protein [Acidobacteriota bacterium]|nr:immunity 50 family protein [Acidobacteriota bacterium]
MDYFDPIKDVENSQLLLDNGEWPNFHDAEVHELNIWRGDVRPEDNVWIGPVITASFELCALETPCIAELRFHDCEDIRIKDFNHQNAIYDLEFEYRSRGKLPDGNEMPPWIAVRFEQAFGAELTLRCMKVEVLARREIKTADKV